MAYLCSSKTQVRTLNGRLPEKNTIFQKEIDPNTIIHSYATFVEIDYISLDLTSTRYESEGNGSYHSLFAVFYTWFDKVS
jgi:hypothetical protein